ncbi:FAD-binding domain-containing protein [Bimuria novae-zelandiae CBS 107.79]|uniref:FAD-binding domain-containing protein n=1 Tax=Bimuria novae-zelandiae CBS 107.79 TaxID=1447943 RepID=A0A6A5VGN8_9PLEO|nr:FAD-binding domain-containing protein [Bimuria novae-zelandiae CBS 107.79]
MLNQGQFPALVTYPKESSQVGPLVKCAVKYGFKVSPRTGQHHFENWSSLNGSLVIDIQNLSYVLPAKDLKTATVGAGSRLGAIYSILEGYGVTFTAGICATVGIGGYLGVGGYNMQMRTEGFAVDHVKSAKIVTAQGDLVTISPTSNPELWWAARGGGTFGVVVETVLETTVLPRSAMFVANFNNASTRFEALKKYNDWAPKQDPYFESQLNFFSDHTQILGWYLGKSKAQLEAILATSGLSSVPNAQIKVTGNCSTANSRNFWTYTQDECTDDATANAAFFSQYNVAPDALTPLPGTVAVSAISSKQARPDIPRAALWQRGNIYTKTFVETKDRPLKDADLQWLVDNTKNLPSEMGFWIEVTTFNVSTGASNSAFPWATKAKTLWRMQVENVAPVAAQSKALSEKFEGEFRPRVGPYTYSGYIDQNVTGDIITANYGANTCRLVKARQKYDPNFIFANPAAVPPKAKASWRC